MKNTRPLSASSFSNAVPRLVCQTPLQRRTGDIRRTSVVQQPIQSFTRGRGSTRRTAQCTLCPAQVAYPYVAKRLLTDTDTGLRDRLLQACCPSRSLAPCSAAAAACLHLELLLPALPLRSTAVPGWLAGEEKPVQSALVSLQLGCAHAGRCCLTRASSSGRAWRI